MKYYIVILNLIRLTKCAIEQLVVEGELAAIGDFPHSGYLSVWCNKKTGVGWSCGSSIVNQVVMLTAAHCVDSCYYGGSVSVSVGYRNKHHGSVSRVYSILIHEQYNRVTLSNDIAILKLKTNLKLNNVVQRLAFDANPPYFEKAFVAGWGWNKDSPPVKESEYLYYTDQYVWRAARCLKASKDSLPKGVICASSRRTTSFASGCHKKSEPGWICGSSIINQRILLTAAHCVDNCWNQNTMTISVGHNHKKKGAVSSVHSFFMHDDYISNKVEYDIALIRLKTNLIFTLDVRRVALSKQPPHSQTAQVAGWGFVKESPKKPTDTLQYMDQYVWTRARCRQVYKMPKGVFCASSKKVNTIVSGGDSGSALVVRGYIQIGIVSYKMPAVSRSLVIYTDTGYFYDWIVKNAKKLYCVIEQ